MSTAIDPQGPKSRRTDDAATTAPADGMASDFGPTTDRVWRELAKASFAVLSCVTSAGQPRSSGVLYAIADQRMYVVVAEDSWKVKHIMSDPHIAVTVPVRRGGIMSLLLPIPPATISFHASATVRPISSWEARPIPKQLESLLPADRRTGTSIIEIQPAGWFVTYGVGVSLMRMRKPSQARGRVPVA